METIKIAATERSPEIHFDFENATFLLKGESYPEDVPAFYGEAISQLKKFLNDNEGIEVTFNFELIYFNSSSAKVLMDLFDTLDQAGERHTITINWIHAADDDNMEEMGEEFAEDLENITFNLKAVD
ncbi:MAG: DUF1987 domain-containing protein [Gammaproteobacteria bacterium]|nr:DUF1987 domain-containing protein [Gammaproteobacteria bacterium]